MKNKEKEIFFGLKNLLRHPEEYCHIRVEVIISSLDILYDRMVAIDCDYILEDDITEEEYNNHFKELFTKEELFELSDMIKQDIKDKKGEK